MLSIQHVLCGVLYYKNDSFKSKIASIVFPDAIRAYSGPRQYTHFEYSEDGNDTSYWIMPDSMKYVTKESVSESLSMNRHLVQNIHPCVIGEKTNINKFYETNSHLPKSLFEGIEMHLKQDMVFDDFIREIINCNNRYNDMYIYNNNLYDGKGIREVIAEIEQYGIYVLANIIYEQQGITVNQLWFEENIKPILEREYPKDLADKTFSYMKIDETFNELITNHDWSKLNDGPITYEKYIDLYNDVLNYMTKKTF